MLPRIIGLAAFTTGGVGVGTNTWTCGVTSVGRVP